MAQCRSARFIGLGMGVTLFLAVTLSVSTCTATAAEHWEKRSGVARKVDGAVDTSAFPVVSWDTLPVFWHAAQESGPFNESTVDFVARFPLATIEKFQSQQAPPVGTGAEAKIVAAARQIKERNATVKVLFYLNSIMDWDMYDLHTYCQQHSHDMWLYDDNDNPVTVTRGQETFNVTSDQVRQIWINTVLNAIKSGYIDGAFVDRGGVPTSFKDVNQAKYESWKHGHDLHMQEIQQQLGPDKIVISNNNDYSSVNGRMFERFFSDDFDKNTPYIDLAALIHEATYPHLAEVHGEPCSPKVFNMTLAAFLVGAGDYAYYACTNGWSVDSGWMAWRDEYSRPLGAPTGPAKAITTAKGYCHSGTAQDDFAAESRFWEQLLDASVERGHDRPMLSKWIDEYWRSHPGEPQPILGRKFASGTCVTVDFSANLTTCISWSDGSVTGSHICT